MRTDKDFRRTVTTFTFCGSGVALTPIVAWSISLVRSAPALVYQLAVGLELLLAVVLIGLSLSVALRQVSAKFLGNEVSASGGDGPGEE